MTSLLNNPEYEDIIFILKKAVWAPTGDNEQPWSIHIQSPLNFRLTIRPTQQSNVYNILPYADYLSAGAFIENANLAAAYIGYELIWTVIDNIIDFNMSMNSMPQSKLFEEIERRTVNRFSYSTEKLSSDVKGKLESVLDRDIGIVWFETFQEKYTIAKLLMLTTDFRLKIPEAYAVHKTIIQWEGKDSNDRIPASALGVNKLTTAITRWSLKKECRNILLQKIPCINFPIQIEMDFIPSLSCAGHFLIYFKNNTRPSKMDLLRAGQNMQRFWLTLSSLGVSMHPWYSPLAFSMMLDKNITFTKDAKSIERARKISSYFEKNILSTHNLNLNTLIFSGRVGVAKTRNIKRSIRKPIESFLVKI